MQFKQWFTGREVNTSKISWPQGEGWQGVFVQPEIPMPPEYLWQNNPEFVVLVGLLFGEDPQFLVSPDGESPPEHWDARGVGFNFMFADQRSYLVGSYGYLDQPNGKSPWMVVGAGDSGQSATQGVLICAKGDQEKFYSYGWI